MAQEIELKFIVDEAGVEALRQHLSTLKAEHTAAGKLLNIYYETEDNWLRRHDMGLRIRGAGDRYEMTLKVAGRTVGGLHQRPEYNIDLDEPTLALENCLQKSGRMARCPKDWRRRCSRCSAPISCVKSG